MANELSTDAHHKDLLALFSDKATRQPVVDAVASVFHREIFGRGFDSYDIDRLQFFAAGIASSQYAMIHMGKARRFGDALSLLQFAIENVTVSNGLALEFGVYSGRTVNHIAKLLPQQRIYGFDSFEGLPETWRRGFQKGAFAVPKLPEVLDNVSLVKGWFDRTLPSFLDENGQQNIALLHVDCDLYSSTQVIFQQLKNRIVPGTIIVFDEYYNYPGWEMNEFLAFKEFVNVNRVSYDYIGIVPAHQQVAVRILG
jgi:hypothetical protein